MLSFAAIPLEYGLSFVAIKWGGKLRFFSIIDIYSMYVDSIDTDVEKRQTI